VCVRLRSLHFDEIVSGAKLVRLANLGGGEPFHAAEALGMETCMILGMLNREQAPQLAGLDYYNHNIDTSERYCGSIVGTRTFGDRLAPNPSEGNDHQLLRRLGMEQWKPA
jgi:hypothetical protein